MRLSDLLRKITTRRPKLIDPAPVEGTDLIEGSTKRNIVIYDPETNKILFGGGNPDLTHIGKLNGSHVAMKQEQVDGNWKTYFVDEKGDVLFGRKYDSDALLLADSTSDEEVDIEDFDPVLQKDVLRGSENTLLEYIGDGYNDGVINVYDNSGRPLFRDIPAFVEETRTHSFGEYKEMRPATRLCFVEIDDQLLLEVKYDQHSEVYETDKTR